MRSKSKFKTLTRTPLRVRLIPRTYPNRTGYGRHLRAEVAGWGTSELEALSSVFCAAADRHWMYPVQFRQALIEQLGDPVPNKVLTYPRSALCMMNGTGDKAKLESERLCQIFNDKTLNFLTFLPWREMLDSRGHFQIKKKLAWCTACWKEDRAIGRRCYVRLLWLAVPVKVCPKHHTSLQTTCQSCHATQEIVPIIPREWICQSCGKDLVKQKVSNRKHDPDAKVVWEATAMGALIRRTCASATPVSEGAFRRVLAELIDHHFCGRVFAFAKRIGLTPKMIRGWLHGYHNPYLSELMEFSYRIGVPPDVLLLDGAGLIDPCQWRQWPKPRFVRRGKNLTKLQLVRIHQALIKALRADEGKVVTLTEFAEKYGISYMTVAHHFPKEAAQLRDRARAVREARQHKRAKQRFEYVLQSAHQLIQHHVYPSDRALKDRYGLCSSDFRRSEIVNALREIRKAVLAGTYRQIRSKTSVTG